MKRFLPLVLLAIMALSCSPSALQIQGRIADGIGRAANAASPQLIDAFEHEGNTVIDGATTRIDAEHGVDAVEQRWRPVWTAWGILREAQNTWADQVERAQRGDPLSLTDAIRFVGAIRNAWCLLRAAIPPPTVLPDVPLVTCEVSDAQH